MAMKRREFLKAIGAATTAAIAVPSALSSTAADSSVEILLNEPIGTINPNLYSHFVEHLGGVVYDGIVLTAVALFSDYPIERPLLGLMFANPVDLGRVLLLLRLDASALMGYTGAVFERFFAGTRGVLLASVALTSWALVPVVAGARMFRRKDF